MVNDQAEKLAQKIWRDMCLGPDAPREIERIATVISTALEDAKRESLADILARLGGDCVVMMNNGATSEQLSDAIYEQALHLESENRHGAQRSAMITQPICNFI